MLTDQQLRLICLILAIGGTIGVVVASHFADPLVVAPGDLSDRQLGAYVHLTGTITTFSTSSGHVFFTLSDSQGKVPVVLFERQARSQPGAYELAKGDNITVIGKVILYKNELEIQADRVMKIS